MSEQVLQRVAEGKRNCQGYSREALGYFLGFGHVNVPTSAREIVGVFPVRRW